MTKITKTAALAHAKAQVGAVHNMSGGGTGYGYLSWDEHRQVWMAPSSTTTHAGATSNRARCIRAHAAAALQAQTLDVRAQAYREALEIASLA